MAIIAGHRFNSMGFCDLPKGEGVCGRRLADIASTHKDDVGKPDIAHSGLLNEAEYKEIVQENDRVWSLMHHPVAAAR